MKQISVRRKLRSYHYPLNAYEQFGLTLELMAENGFDNVSTPHSRISDFYFAQIIRPHKLFLLGDIVGVRVNNGQCRYPVFSVSSRGFRIIGYYFSAYENDGFIKMIEWPSDIASLPPYHPTTQCFVAETLRASFTKFGRRGGNARIAAS